MKRVLLLLFFCPLLTFANQLYIPMDASQANHLKAYGLTYWILQKQIPVDWLLNYQGGSFLCEYRQEIENEAIVRGVTYQVISDADADNMLSVIASPSSNQDLMRLEQYPRIAVYTPRSESPWDDAVVLALDYAEIPYETLYDEEVLLGELSKYDWLHLHHEDFTGQYGKFHMAFHMHPWYQAQRQECEDIASKFGYQKVSQLKLKVAQEIQEFVLKGGYMFAMCSATDTYDIALAAAGTDMAAAVYDGDGVDRAANEKLDFSSTFAFTQFTVVTNPWEVEFSSIDIDLSTRPVAREQDYFSLFEFSAKWDPIPTMLTQNHEKTIKGFLGATTSFRKQYIRPNVIILGENRDAHEAKYIHGEFGKGFWTFYGGHDPEDYQHNIGEQPTDLSLHPNSPGYRLILNNILFPAAKKKKQKT
uniref:Asparagine synthetase B n=1 Tax=Roseihalotalea indica TaxID=2867963 RepID=A0AA49JGD2_9BACT|nr:asparagine synthetase B [Tunicatimonas sp. TK19036]